MCSNLKVALCTLMLISGIVDDFAGNSYVHATNGHQNKGVRVAKRELTREEAMRLPVNNGHVEIPYGVTSIGKNAFYGCTRLTSVTIPDSVTSIGYYAFSKTELGSITIPDSVMSIGVGTFSKCDSLKCINVYSDMVKKMVTLECYWYKWFKPEMIHVVGEK